MAENVEAFWEAAATLADQRGYRDMPSNELMQLGEQAFLDYAAVLAALDRSARKRHIRTMVERLGPEYILFV